MRASVVAAPSEEELLALGTLLARSGKVIESEISGTSMGRTLPSGTRIRIQPPPNGEYRLGQTVAFVRGSTIYAHRVVYCTSQGVVTRGDNHSWCDLPVPIGAVLGVVTESFIGGEWHGFTDAPEGLPPQAWRSRALETAVRACMRIDIRLARHTLKALMSLVRFRQR
jgi:hypothetical protein